MQHRWGRWESIMRGKNSEHWGEPRLGDSTRHHLQLGEWMRGNSNTNCKCSHKFSHGGTVNILCLDSGLREVAVWSVEKALREWIPEWMQATDLGTASQELHSLRLRYGKAFLLGLRQVLTVCGENLHHSYPPLDIYGLKTPPLERLLLLR